ncbi:MAG: NADH dehydrogenase subunit [Ignavibacteria bacterium]|nr:NADH dehydrogenase subunit [Ignavibacteria bacterium]
MISVDHIRNAGVVGCGGAGFPTHIKAASRVDIALANGAECEPLLHKDQELMRREPDAVVSGLQMLQALTGSGQAIVGVKLKHQERIAGLVEYVTRAALGLHWLGDFYPTGDEYILVYEATKRLIPPQGIPLDVGVIVNNVETLRNIHNASKNIPVTTKYITVAGAVKNPSTFVVPVGTSFADVINAAGGPTVSSFAVFVSGIMMGKFVQETDLPVTKTCAGIVVLPMDHHLVQRRLRDDHAMHRIGRSACDQCSYCTELCPRYLLGYDVQPHKVMRGLAFTAAGEDLWNQWAQLCCACGLCTLYACPEDLYPKEACDKAKRDMRAKNVAWEGVRDVKLHPMYDGRHVPLGQLIRKLGVEEYNVPAPFRDAAVTPRRIRLPLAQHIGSPAEAVVSKGDRVRAGDLVGEIPKGKTGARIHASISGKVISVDSEITIEQ